MTKKERLEEAMSNAMGSEHWYKAGPLFPKFLYTDGVAQVLEIAEAHWLADAIFSTQGIPKLRAAGFQLWVLKVVDGKGVLTCREDTDAPVLYSQEFGYTDFPLSEITFYFIDGTLLLPSEY